MTRGASWSSPTWSCRPSEFRFSCSSYYTAVGFGLIYFTTVFGFSVKDGNGLGNWTWGFNVIAVIAFGLISDKLRVRKPFMVIGGVCAAIMLVLYLERAGQPTSYYHLAVLVAILSFFLGVAYVPWMASFTETVEHRNPALTATGLAIWGWILRVVVFVSYLVLPSCHHLCNPARQLRNPGRDSGGQVPERAGVRVGASDGRGGGAKAGAGAGGDSGAPGAVRGIACQPELHRPTSSGGEGGRGGHPR